MAVAQGTCPGCGAPVEFGVGSSLAKVCEFCRTTVVRSEHGLENLGKVAELAKVPSLVAVGDTGMLAGYPFMVMGQLQLDYGKGVWEEYYLSYGGGQAWGWLAYDDGIWYASSLVPWFQPPPYGSLQLEQDVQLDGHGVFRVAESRSGSVVTAKGEIPFPVKPGEVFYYTDLRGPNGTYATIDYGDNSDDDEVDIFKGRIFYEHELVVNPGAPSHTVRAKTGAIKCQSCGGELHLQSGARAWRVGCGYCGAVNDLTGQGVVAQQQAFSKPEIPIGTHAVFGGIEYIVIAYLVRSEKEDGERYSWEEYLLWGEKIGYRWLEKDEGKWTWSMSISVADLDLSGMPKLVGFNGKKFKRTEKSKARVDYVLGEVYWECSVGEKEHSTDFEASNGEKLSREATEGEVQWSYATPVPWSVIQQGLRR